jgi:hypothetical protein
MKEKTIKIKVPSKPSVYNGKKCAIPMRDELDEAMAGMTDEQKLKAWEETKPKYTAGIDPYQKEGLKWWQAVLEFLGIKKYNRGSCGAVLFYGSDGSIKTIKEVRDGRVVERVIAFKDKKS